MGTVYIQILNKKMVLWRRVWDSNPRYILRRTAI
ncbi:uncharacterized protein METZ01_LOCUS459843, partial [marine metagenome]